MKKLMLICHGGQKALYKVIMLLLYLTSCVKLQVEVLILTIFLGLVVASIPFIDPGFVK